jgi:hypothetical protein
MKNLAILGVFILMSVQSMAQTGRLSADRIAGNKILQENGLANRQCMTLSKTPQGLLISSRTEDNVPINYLYTPNNPLVHVESLDGYIVFMYSPVKGDLLMAKYQYGHTDSMCHEVYTYNMTTKKFVKQCDFGWIYGVPKFSVTYDSILVNVMVKNSDGIGSHDVTKIAKLK